MTSTQDQEDQSTSKSHFASLRSKLPSLPFTNTKSISPKRTSTSPTSSASTPSSREQDKSQAKAAKAVEQAHLRNQVQMRRQESDLRAQDQETGQQRSRYGHGLPPPDWREDDDAEIRLEDLVHRRDNDKTNALPHKVIFRARIHAIRNLSSHLAFIVLRQQTLTIQSVITDSLSTTTTQQDPPSNTLATTETSTGHMVRWSERLPLETIVLVRGHLTQPKARVEGATFHDVELKITDIFVLSEPTVPLPFSVNEAERPVYDPETGRDGTKTDGGATPEHPQDDNEDDSQSSNSDITAGVESDTSDSDEEGKEVGEKRDQVGELEEAQGSETTSGKKQRNSVPPPLSKRVRLANRTVDLRAPVNQSIFRIQSIVSTVFRTSLLEQGFIEIHTPKLQAGSSESGSSVFQLDYFGRPAFLAQSPQLYKQLAISADFRRVFEVGPVFRAENSNTARHLTEYTGLDLEMAIERDYRECIHVIDAMLKNVFHAIRSKLGDEERIVREHFGGGECVWIEETPILTFQEGIKMLRESGWKEEDGSEPSEDEDLATRTEHRLCELVKEKYGTDFFFLDKFPSSARPFYTMSDPSLPGFTNSFDIFLRGSEISSGGQRIHDPKVLEKRIRSMGMDTRTLEEYLDGFRYGMPPHAGTGLGLERVVTTFLGLGDVRWSTLYHRDPKSLPERKGPPPLRHDDADTVINMARQLELQELHDGAAKTATENKQQARKMGKAEMAVGNDENEGSKHPKPALESLIANYGDSTNTSWLDERFERWREPLSGAMVGYVKRKRFAIITGNPLCDPSQYQHVIECFLQHLRSPEVNLKPIWLLVGEEVEEILAAKLNWSAVSCVVEQRVPLEGRAVSLANEDMGRKLRKAEKEGLEIQEFLPGDKVPDSVKKELDEKVQEWQKERAGKKQMHLTNVELWADSSHRAYFIGRTPSGEIQCVVVLAQLSPRHGWQLKWAMSMPGSLNGSIENTIVHALNTYASDNFTFGAAAAGSFEVVHGVGLLTGKTLARIFKTIVRSFGLNKKSEFRHKLGVREERLYIAFPRGGLKKGGIRALVHFFEE